MGKSTKLKTLRLWAQNNTMRAINELTDSEYRFSLSELAKETHNNTLLISNQTYRLAVYCMGLWFWIISGVTYFGIIIDDDNLSNAFRVLFYLTLCSVSLMIGGIISTSISNKNAESSKFTKCIKYTSGIMWLLSGLLLFAVIGWSFHMNYTDYHGIDIAYFAMTNLGNYLLSLAVCWMISSEIIYNYGGKYIYFNIKLLSLTLCIRTLLFLIPIYQNKHSQMYYGRSPIQDTTIIIVMHISYLLLCLSSFIIFIIFVFINKLQWYSHLKRLTIITLIILNISAVFTQTLNIDTSSFEIYSQKTAGQGHSNFLFLALITYLCYIVFIVVNNISSINFDQQNVSLILNSDKNSSHCYEYNNYNLDGEQTTNLNINLLQHKPFRIMAYCLCLWYWLLPDLCQYIMYLNKLSHELSEQTKTAMHFLVFAFSVYIIAIILISFEYVFKFIKYSKYSSKIAQLLFIIGSILMIISGVYVINAECTHFMFDYKSKLESIYCGIGQITTHFIGIVLPIYITLDIQFDINNMFRPISNLIIFFIGAVIWTLIIYRYDIDIKPSDNEKFRDDMAFVIRLGWTIMDVSSFIIVLLLLFTVNKSMKIVKRIFCVLLLISSGFCIINFNDAFGGSITVFEKNNPANNPYIVLWNAQYSKNYYFTVFFFCCIACYDVLMHIA
eukprot:294326_1